MTAETIRPPFGLENLLPEFQKPEAEGTDVIEASLLRAQEKGMEAFITYRMNDLHFADTSYHCPIHYSDFWLAHPRYWLGDSTQGWHSAGALNFAIEAVRQRKLDIITEQLQKYEMIDGSIWTSCAFRSISKAVKDLKTPT